jgi:hypothetical protein
MTIPKLPTWYAALLVKPKRLAHASDEQKMDVCLRASDPGKLGSENSYRLERSPGHKREG